MSALQLAWANRIVACYVKRKPFPNTGKPLNIVQWVYARQALGITAERLEEMRAEQDAINAGFAPAFSDDVEEAA